MYYIYYMCFFLLPLAASLSNVAARVLRLPVPRSQTSWAVAFKDCSQSIESASGALVAAMSSRELATTAGRPSLEAAAMISCKESFTNRLRNKASELRYGPRSSLLSSLKWIRIDVK